MYYSTLPECLAYPYGTVRNKTLLLNNGWYLFKSECKHHPLFLYSRPLSIIAVFYRPRVLSKTLHFSISFISDGCQESFQRSAMPLCKWWHWLVQMCRWPFTETKLLCTFSFIFVMLLSKIIAFSNGLDNHPLGAKLFALPQEWKAVEFPNLPAVITQNQKKKISRFI